MAAKSTLWSIRSRSTSSGSLQRRHRSDSRRISERKLPYKDDKQRVVRRRDHCPGALRVGDPVQVFSRQAKIWFDAEVASLMDNNHVRLEWRVDETWFGKTVHILSDSLYIPSRVEECDPEVSFGKTALFLIYSYLCSSSAGTFERTLAIHEGEHKTNHRFLAPERTTPYHHESIPTLDHRRNGITFLISTDGFLFFGQHGGSEQDDRPPHERLREAARISPDRILAGGAVTKEEELRWRSGQCNLGPDMKAIVNWVWSDDAEGMKMRLKQKEIRSSHSFTVANKTILEIVKNNWAHAITSPSRKVALPEAAMSQIKAAVHSKKTSAANDVVSAQELECLQPLRKAELLRKLASALSTNDAEAKIRFLEQALHIQESDDTGRHIDISMTLLPLADAYGSLGDARKSKDHLKRALDIQEREYGTDHRDLASTLSKLAGAYVRLGDAKRSKDLLERAMVIQEREFGMDHHELAKTLSNLATVYLDLGDARKSRDLAQRALDIKERIYDRDHGELAPTLENLATAHLRLGDAAKSRDLLSRAMEIQEREYGTESPELAGTLENLGSTHLKLGDAIRSKEFLERAIKIQERTYGADHRELAPTLGNLATAHMRLGELGKSRDLFDRALAIKEREYSTDHPELAPTLTNLAIVCSRLGDTNRSKELLEQAKTIQERAFGTDCRELAPTLTNLAIAYMRLNDPERGKDLLERALAIKEQAYGKEHRELAPTLTNLASVYLSLGDTHGSRETLERAVAIQEREYGMDHNELAPTLSNLATVYAKLGDAIKSKDIRERASFIKKLSAINA